MTLCIKSRADALANLPSRARWFPQGDAAIRQRNGSRDQSALLGQTDGGFFMSRILNQPSLSREQDEVSFLDPWAARHDGIVPEDAQFVGAWRVDLGIDDV